MDNYYSNQIREYIVNFENAVNEIDNISKLLNDLYSSFSSASGVDIEKIRNDIEIVIDEVNGIKNNLSTAKNKTIERAASCDRCYQKCKNASYPAYQNGDYEYFAGADVYIESDGLIHVRRTYTKKQSFLESLFISKAGEYIQDKVISKEEMFSS